MLNVGLTGGIASGKTTVDRMFQEKGAYLIDHDALAHEAEMPDRDAWKKIVSFFGEEILNPDRTIDRTKLGAVVFSNEEKRRMLMEIVHPIVFDEWQKRLSEIADKNLEAIVVSDVPLLIERGWQDSVDVIVLVYISREEQVRRLMARNGYSRKETEDRLASQMAIDDKILFADFIVNNEGSLDRTRAHVDSVWTKLLEREKSKRMRNIFFRTKERPKRGSDPGGS